MTIVKTVDSFTAPSAQQLALAKAAGVVAWNGYLPGKGIDSTWTSADFARIKDAGLHCIAYASGWADPLVMRGLANQWGVRGCLDVEAGIRGDGPWVQPWLDASGFGVYHQESGFPGYAAPFHIVADYVSSDPLACWPVNLQRPAGPVGWQWKSNVAAYGSNVDLCWFDSEILGIPPPPPPPVQEDDVTILVTTGVRPKGETEDPNGQGAVYLVFGGFKRHIVGAVADSLPEWTAKYGPIQNWAGDPFDLDHLIEMAPIDGSYPVLGWERPGTWQPPGPVP